jgi:hypothetical protein
MKPAAIHADEACQMSDAPTALAAPVNLFHQHLLPKRSEIDRLAVGAAKLFDQIQLFPDYERQGIPK